jgi:hypothetical protein
MPRHTVSKAEYLRILNETLARHPAYSAGMAFHNILPDGSHSYEIVMPASVPDRVRAEQVFDAVANEVRQRYACVPRGQAITRRRRLLRVSETGAGYERQTSPPRQNQPALDAHRFCQVVDHPSQPVT